jgi:hypothetical protein
MNLSGKLENSSQLFRPALRSDSSSVVFHCRSAFGFVVTFSARPVEHSLGCMDLLDNNETNVGEDESW